MCYFSRTKWSKKQLMLTSRTHTRTTITNDHLQPLPLAVYAAIRNNDIDSIKDLFYLFKTKRPQLFYTLEENGFGFLQYAIKFNNLQAAEFILNYFLDPNNQIEASIFWTISTTGNSILHLAAELSYSLPIQSLLHSAINPFLTFTSPAQIEHTDIYRLKDANGNNFFNVALCKRQNAAFCLALLQRLNRFQQADVFDVGLIINNVNHTGENALQQACRLPISSEKHQLIHLLLTLGADATIVNNQNETALYIASSLHDIISVHDILSELPATKREQIVLTMEHSGNTPLHVACTQSEEMTDTIIFQLTEILIYAGAKLDYLNLKLHTPIDLLSTQEQKTRLLSFLNRYGALIGQSVDTALLSQLDAPPFLLLSANPGYYQHYLDTKRLLVAHQALLFINEVTALGMPISWQTIRHHLRHTKQEHIDIAQLCKQLILYLLSCEHFSVSYEHEQLLSDLKARLNYIIAQLPASLVKNRLLSYFNRKQTTYIKQTINSYSLDDYIEFLEAKNLAASIHAIQIKLKRIHHYIKRAIAHPLTPMQRDIAMQLNRMILGSEHSLFDLVINHVNTSEFANLIPLPHSLSGLIGPNKAFIPAPSHSDIEIELHDVFKYTPLLADRLKEQLLALSNSNKEDVFTEIEEFEIDIDLLNANRIDLNSFFQTILAMKSTLETYHHDTWQRYASLILKVILPLAALAITLVSFKYFFQFVDNSDAFDYAIAFFITGFSHLVFLIAHVIGMKEQQTLLPDYDSTYQFAHKWLGWTHQQKDWQLVRIDVTERELLACIVENAQRLLPHLQQHAIDYTHELADAIETVQNPDTTIENAIDALDKMARPIHPLLTRINVTTVPVNWQFFSPKPTKPATTPLIQFDLNHNEQIEIVAHKL